MSHGNIATTPGVWNILTKI